MREFFFHEFGMEWNGQKSEPRARRTFWSAISIVRCIQIGRLGCLGHLQRMCDRRFYRRLFDEDPDANRRRGQIGKRW